MAAITYLAQNHMKKIIILGYGNPDRGDDGVAWHILMRLFNDLQIKDADLFCCDIISLTSNTDVWFNFQLLPEIAENLSTYQKAIFLDAHTGEIKENVKFSPVEPEFSNSPFTHHMTPATLLALSNTLTGKHPESWLLSIRGHEFEFNRELTEKTMRFAEEALLLLKKELSI